MPNLVNSNHEISHLPITQLNQLVQALLAAPSDKFFNVAKHIHLSQKDVLPYATWSKTRHTRNCIAVNDRFELILICWGPGQCSSVYGESLTKLRMEAHLFEKGGYIWLH